MRRRTFLFISFLFFKFFTFAHRRNHQYNCVPLSVRERLFSSFSLDSPFSGSIECISNNKQQKMTYKKCWPGKKLSFFSSTKEFWREKRIEEGWSWIDRARIANLGSDKTPIRMNWNLFGCQNVIAIWIWKSKTFNHRLVWFVCSLRYLLSAWMWMEKTRKKKNERKILIKEPKNRETKRNGQKSVKRKNKFY